MDGRAVVFFLRDGGSKTTAFLPGQNSLLALQFAIVHSLLLAPSTRTRLAPWIPSAFYGCFFCAATCLQLLLAIQFWVRSPNLLYELHGPTAAIVECGFFLSWAALFYSLALSGLGYQTGWTPWWHWFRDRRLPPRQFLERGAYRWFRHPIYLSFLGLIWFTPRMTLDHAVLTGWWTVYIFVGSYLKDERLAFYLGDTYRDYQRRVPGYPLLHFGPLGLRRFVNAPAGGSEHNARHDLPRKAA